MSPRALLACRPRGSFPRVSGDEPAGAILQVEANGFSPRERG